MTFITFQSSISNPGVNFVRVKKDSQYTLGFILQKKNIFSVNMGSQLIVPIFLIHLILLISPIVKSDSLHRAAVVNAIAADTATASENAIHQNAAMKADATAAASAEAAASAGAVPPVIPPVGPIVPPIVPPIGAGAGFHKNIDFSFGKGIGLLPFLSGIIPGIGGVGGVPPIVPGVEPVVPPVEPGLLGGLGGLFPGYLGTPFGTSYVPSTWIGSALGAKGDLLFPILIFLFAVVGVWAVAHFLLSLIVPLIASKLLLAKGVVAAKKVLRAAEEEPADNRQSILDSLTHTVTSALAEEKCLKLITCQTGNFMRNVAGPDRSFKIAEIVKGLNSTSEAMKVFQSAAENGQDCSQFSCWGEPIGAGAAGASQGAGAAVGAGSANKSNVKAKPSSASDGIHKPLAGNVPLTQHSHDPVQSNDLGNGNSPNISSNSAANDSLLHKHPLLSAFLK